MGQMLAGFQVSQALYVAAKLGVADDLADGPRPTSATAEALGVDPDALARLMRTLGSMGVLTETAPGTYGTTPLGDTLRAGVPGSMRDLALMWMETHYAPFSRLLDTVRTGRCGATEYYGRPFFDWLADDDDRVRQFTAAMANLTDGLKVGTIDAYPFTEMTEVVDVGAADGALLAHVLAAHPKMHGVAFDMPHVVEAARSASKRFDLGARLELVGGDFFEQVPGGADAYLLSMILHDWDDERAARILATIRAAAPSGARVLSLELVVPPGDTPHIAKMIDLTMLGMLTGRERTEAELRELFSRAGLRVDDLVHTPTPMTIVEAVVP
jgi:hypothetical protein